MDNAPIFAFIIKSTFSDIAATPPIRSYTVEEARTVPLTMEQYVAIERPEVDVKPVEIGHLNLLRLSDPPKRLVVGDTLSDLLLPSMPALIIAVDTDISITNGELYQTGHLCSGDCSKAETVDVNLPPGLYLGRAQNKMCSWSRPRRGGIHSMVLVIFVMKSSLSETCYLSSILLTTNTVETWLEPQTPINSQKQN